MSDEKKSDFDYSWGPTETECCCPVECCCQKMIQMEEDLRAEISSLTLELFFFKSDRYAYFVLIPNKIISINETATCCDKKCINTNLLTGTCKSKNGYVNVRYNGKLKYFLSEELIEEKNNWIKLVAQNAFTREKCYYQRNSLFYFEVKMIKETKKQCYAGIGFDDKCVNIFLCNETLTNWEDFQKFSWEDGDVFGCGALFKPKKESHITVFFTKNGEKIGNDIYLEEIDKLVPTIELKAISVEVNFGYDLETKPFIYDINKHSC